MSNRIFVQILAALCWIAVVVPSQAQQSSVTREDRATFMQARAGDSSATDKAEITFGRLSVGNPGDPLARAYHGAALTLQGRDAWMPWTKMKKVEQGLAQLDKALAQITAAQEQSPAGQLSAAMETRMTAIGTFIALPGMFHRLESARAVIKQTLNHPGFAMVPKAQQAQIYSWAAEAAEKSGEKSEAERLARLARESGWIEARR